MSDLEKHNSAGSNTGSKHASPGGTPQHSSFKHEPPPAQTAGSIPILSKFKETENLRKDSITKLREQMDPNRKLSAFNAKNARLGFLHKKSTLEEEDDDDAEGFIIKKYKALVNELTPEEVEEFKAAFDKADPDHTDNISLAQLENAIRSMGHNPTQQEMKDILALADLDKSGTVSYQEFLTLMALQMKQPFTEEELLAAFELFDLEDGEAEGVVDAEMMKQAMIDLLPNTTEEEINEFIASTEPDENGQIDYINYVKKLIS